MGTANRVSIRPYLVEWLKQIGQAELGTDDLSEIVNTLLLDRKRGLIQSQVSEPTASNAAMQPDFMLNELTELLG